MIRAGFTIENPRTKSRTVVIESDVETNGWGWVLEVHTPPKAGPDITEHFHQTWTESFEILSGQAYYRLDGVQKTAQAGETIVMPPGKRQVHPWNAGDSELVYRQRNDFGEANPQAVQDVIGLFATLAGLTRLGQVDENGHPRNPLQLAVTLRTLIRYGGYDASLPVGLQNFIAATLGRLAESLGYRAIHPEYLNIAAKADRG